MKAFVLVAILSLSGFANAKVITCTSHDFDAQNYNGVSLNLTIGDDGKLLSAVENEGTPGAGLAPDNNPKLVNVNSKAAVYSVNFQSDSWNQRLIIPHGSSVVKYTFSYATDEQYETADYILECK